MQELNEILLFEQAISNHSKMVIDFYAPWCGPCRAMAPTFAKWGKTYEDKASFAKVNVDEVPELAEKHRINALPTVLIFENGKEVRRWEGFPQENDLVGAL